VSRAPRCFAAAALAAALASPLAAQDYPKRPIRFMIGFAPGGSADIVSRLLGQNLAERLGQPVIAEQKMGASGLLANDVVAKAAPDGPALVLLTGGHPVAAVIMKERPYDPVRDFGMVSVVTGYPMVISVAPQSPIKTLPDLLSRAKAGRITFATSGPGSLHDLVGELINVEAGIEMVSVPYKGAALGSVDLLGGRVDVMVETATFSFPQIRAGKLRPLALSSSGRYPLMPDVPTIAETLPGVEASSWLGLATSPGTPRPVIDRLNREVRAIVETPEVRQRLAELGGVPSPSTPEEMRERIEREIAKWKRVVELKKIERQ
jgi:tripartite-type tricarboxylate transporter receptor subunit TctC